MPRTFYERLQPQILNHWLIHQENNKKTYFIVFGETRSINNVDYINGYFYVPQQNKSVSIENIYSIYDIKYNRYNIKVDLAFILRSYPCRDHDLKDKLNLIIAKRLLQGDQGANR